VVNKQIQTTKTHQLTLMPEDLTCEERLIGSFDLQRIEQILSNLISNAVKYSAAGSAIEVGIRPRRDGTGRAQEVLLWVKDQGVGIEAAALPHIFERFYRAKIAEKSVSGFGIGLYLTRELVVGHGGRIWVESTEGFGSTFFVVLPLEHPSITSGKSGSHKKQET
jgi:signal transduction histidine kinase